MGHWPEKTICRRAGADRFADGQRAIGSHLRDLRALFRTGWQTLAPYSRPAQRYPLDNELDSVTVISADSLDGDIWTTLLFGLGVEKGCAALRQRQDIDAIFVTKNRDIILSSPQRLRFAPLDSGYRVIDCTA